MPAKSLSKSKVSEVVSITAHQLKTPISIVKGYLEALLSQDYGDVNDKQKEYLTDALENTKRMSRIVNNLLDVSRIEAGNYKLDNQKFFLKKICEDVIHDFSSWAAASNAKLILIADDDLALTISDPFKIRQVVENIVSNSLKYKRPGPGKIEVRLKRKGRSILFSCKDAGIGIDRAEKERLFTKFYRSEKAVELDASGTGLGLYINRAIIELSGGKIWAEKNPGAGSTFYFTLPNAK